MAKRLVQSFQGGKIRGRQKSTANGFEKSLNFALLM
jgi:hypothetical protein